MGEFAEAVQSHLCTALDENFGSIDWKTEYEIGGTPVDIGGDNGKGLCLIELEWRRADPADNGAKLFRHLDQGTIEAQRVVAFQVFSEHYDLKRGGVSSKRMNAEFVGKMAAESFSHLSYIPIELPLDPPKQSEDWQSNWKVSCSPVIAEICEVLGTTQEF